MVQKAREADIIGYVGDGDVLWPAVAREDAAELCALAVEMATPGARWHAVAEQGVPLRAIAEAIGRGLGIVPLSMTVEETIAHYGLTGRFMALSTPASSVRTREKLSWQPRGIGLIDELDALFAG